MKPKCLVTRRLLPEAAAYLGSASSSKRPRTPMTSPGKFSSKNRR